MQDMKARYFYHSFARRSPADENGYGKELQILQSMLDVGLLLTPERIEFKERLRDGSYSEPATIFQKRICFTELSEEELPAHCTNFGEFSIEWDQEILRKLGAIPVFYVPLKGELGSAETAAASILARLGDIQSVLERLAYIQEVSRDDVAARPIEVFNSVTGEVEKLFDKIDGQNLVAYLEKDVQPIQELLNSLRATFGYFYPTENLEYGDLLSYYRQREWRIVGSMVLDGVELTADLDHAETVAVSKIDTQFFDRELDYPTGKKRIAEQILKYPSFGGRHILETCRRIIVPASVQEQVREILRGGKIQVKVDTL